MKDRVIVVTGGTGILGSAFIEAITNAGDITGILGRNEKVAEERVSEAIGKRHLNASANPMN